MFWVGLVLLLAGAFGDEAPIAFPFRSRYEAKHDYAYVTIYYEVGIKDYEYFTACRVLFRSIKDSGSSVADLVVLVDSSVRQSWRDIFAADGIIVVEIEDVAPPDRFHTRRRFLYSLNKLVSWDLVAYKRVIFFDADVLAIRNPDFLFNCGHFCAVFFNPISFHTSLLVVAPSHDAFQKIHNALSHLDSFDGADQGFLNAYYRDLQDAPLFKRGLVDGSSSTLKGSRRGRGASVLSNTSFFDDVVVEVDESVDAHSSVARGREGAVRDAAGHSAIAPGGPLESPLYRVPVQYHVNHVYFYEKYSWEGVWGGEANLVSMTYPIAPALKPWCWQAYPILHEHFRWHTQRLKVESHASYLPFLLLTAVFVAAAVLWPCVDGRVSKTAAAVAASEVGRLVRAAVARMRCGKTNSPTPPRSAAGGAASNGAPCGALTTTTSKALAVTVGVVVVFLLLYVPFKAIPTWVLWEFAWPLAISIHTFLSMVAMSCMRGLLYGGCAMTCAQRLRRSAAFFALPWALYFGVLSPFFISFSHGGFAVVSAFLVVDACVILWSYAVYYALFQCAPNLFDKERCEGWERQSDRRGQEGGSYLLENDCESRTGPSTPTTGGRMNVV